MPRSARAGRATAVAVGVAIAAGGAGGCSELPEPRRACVGSSGRVPELAREEILGMRPAGATVPRGYEKVDAACWFDSGHAQAYAERTYAYAGSREDVLLYYRTAAEQDGWTQQRAEPDLLCLTRDGDSARTMLTVAFLPADAFAYDDRKPGPELTAGHPFRVTVSKVLSGDGGCDG
ncbi:hypothetical protein AB0424_11700 [Streptomyces sp. NPDC051180]|uniref:hypothetical protein n=1 Tax=Streptomyces sp. NPDC051180 TaxID=3155797 RepID=UPI00344FF8F1